ncbi:MAG: 5'-nucleotidase C-terminal domain-containing protein [Bacteroidales bacterium]
MLNARNSLWLLLWGVILFASCENTEQKQYTLRGEVIQLDSINVPETDTEQESIIREYRETLEADMSRVLVQSAQVMERGTPEGLLNNFVADLVFDIGKDLYQPDDDKGIDFCLLNYGGLRVPLPEGEITYERVFELLPFENEMVVVTISGQKTRELFEYLAAADRGMPVSGLTLTIKDDEPHEILIQGEELDTNRSYKVLTSDYLAGGGDLMNFFLQPINYELLGMRVRDAIILHMQQVNDKGEKIESELDGRISVIK